MNKAFKFRIYPTKEQEELLSKTFGCVRFVYNKMLSDRISHYNETGESLNNTPAQYKKEFEWLKEVDSLALANAQLNLNKAYKNFFRDKSIGFPKFKSRKNNHRSYTTNCVNGNIKLDDGYLTLPKLKAVKIKQHRMVPDDYKLKSVTISKTPTGKYFASILYEYEKHIELAKPEKFVGMDYSMKELFITSDGISAEYPRYYRLSLEKLKKEQRKLSKCEKGSNNRNKQRLKVAKFHEKVANQRKDFLHKTSKQITNAFDGVCIEDLSMKGMSQALNFGKSVSDNSFGTFVSMLDYKLKEQGKQLVKIDKWFPSSKMCSACGQIKDALSLSDRTYHCEHCGLSLDRDYNASINIRNEGMRILSA
ncbi:RNA-guided endonuclease TnpB family protein [Clostridium formicaceticum]|uniref:Transposase n=1 Tax=Clostridium formicaceticum TaxID=1497 RepID=A0AAC9WFI5_9CLOT|nr:RNA-guided endonuclease TnpB family protein [Clostridium formicaceticum]AOY76353.1 transposase [Clostridium formicaceticum]ARE86744.1 putative transposase [Clostridium formicaceticum]